MSRLLRALILFLAALPAVWGNCPGAFTGRCCCAPAADAPTEGCCAACADHDRDPRPTRPSTPCSRCPCRVARDGSTPAPAAVDAPHTTAIVFVGVPTLLVALAPAPVTGPRAVEGHPPGRAPVLVGTIVLVV